MNGDADKNTIIDAIAPCAFCCFTCAAKNGGVIAETSTNLVHYLEGYYEFTKRNLPFSRRSYSRKVKFLINELEHMSERPCNGCRAGSDKRCCIPNCFISECVKIHSVDFCGECSEFPCEKASEFFKGDTYTQWMLNNESIKNDGAEKYYEYACSHSHYDFYHR